MKRYKLMLFLNYVVYLVVIYVETMIEVGNQDELLTLTNPQTALYYFFQVQFGGFGTPWAAIMTLLTATSLGSAIFVYAKNNASFINLHQRMGYQSYLIRALKYSFLGGFFTSITTAMYELILLNQWVHPLFPLKDWKMDLDIRYHPFNDGTLGGLLTYIMLCAIGWGIFAMFIFAISLFVKKTSLALFIGPIIGISMTVFSVLLLRISQGKLTEEFYINGLLTLVAPGQESIREAGIRGVQISFLISAIGCLIMTYLLLRGWHNGIRQKGRS